MTRVEKLISISSEPLTRRPPVKWDLIQGYSLGADLLAMLERKNGFYAFESALHVFPLTEESLDEISLAKWNADATWHCEYGELAKGLLSFAEDVFQNQFCLSQLGVMRFCAETGGTKPVADSIEQWADLMLQDYEYEAGWTLAHEWQRANGSLPPGKRLMAKIPFFLGGAYSVENLWVGDAVEGMHFKADLAMQTRYLRDGTPVRIVVGQRPPD